MKTKQKRGLSFYIIFLLLALGAILMFLPLVWMVLSSFKTQTELFRMPPSILPEQWVTSNFQRVFDTMPFLRYYANSVGTGIVNTVVGVFTSTIVGYVFAKYKFPFRNLLFVIVLSFMMIPYDTMMIPLYKLMTGLGWTNSYLVLTVPYFVNITGIFLMRQFFMDLPDDYLEAAEIDGCGQFKTFWRIAMPMARPAMATLVIFLFMASYNSYLWPLISVNSRDFFTLPVGIAAMMFDRGNQMDLMMAASTMIILPVCILFGVAQKNFVEGLTMGGVKG